MTVFNNGVWGSRKDAEIGNAFFGRFIFKNTDANHEPAWISFIFEDSK